jgi:hypothetical protein
VELAASIVNVETLHGVTGRGVEDSKEKKEPQRRRMMQGHGRTWIGDVEEKKRTTRYKKRAEWTGC